jgi:hypothetical protein
MMAELCFWKHLALRASTVAILVSFLAIVEGVVIAVR